MSRPITEAERNAAKFPPAKSIGEQILGKAQDSRSVVQEFVPLADSLEWELGQQYLKNRGNKAFISDAMPVPFIINNDGSLSRNAAEVFFTSLLEAEKAGTLEPDIFVLELGIGVGLFARFFLDHMQDLCEKQHKDYYERLTYIAADRSERMLMDVVRHGVFANHPGRYRLRQVDAMCPEKDLPHDAAFVGHPRKERPFRAVFLNYLLDCLPAAMLEMDGDQVKELHVRTCVARNIKLEDYSDMTLDQLKERAKSRTPTAMQELLEVYGLFASEYDYRPVDASKIPYSAFCIEYARRFSKRFLLSHGALHSLDRLLDLVADDGFILINDYGQTQLTRDDEFEHQRFSLATFVGVNFLLLKHYFEGRAEWVAPQSEAGGIHSRLLSRKRHNEIVVKFWERFSKTAYDHLHEYVDLARNFARVGKFELAGNYYGQALERQPGNWVLLNEISMFLTFSWHDPLRGLDAARQALVYNPTCSAELWNTLGDGLFAFGRIEEAQSAYFKALEVNDSDVRARFNLAFCFLAQKNFSAALEVIAHALALDRTGEYSRRLLDKMSKVMEEVGQRHRQEYLLLINLVSKYGKKDEPEPTKPEAAGAEVHNG